MNAAVEEPILTLPMTLLLKAFVLVAARIWPLIGRCALLDLAEAGKSKGSPANPPRTALDFLDKDTGVGAQTLTNIRDYRLSDVLDHLGRLVLCEFALEYLDRDERHCEILLGEGAGLDLPHPSVNVYLDARDVGRIRAREEQNCFRNFLWLSKPLHRDSGEDTVCHGVDGLLGKPEASIDGSRNRARADSIDADAASHQLRCRGSSKRANGSLAG